MHYKFSNIINVTYVTMLYGLGLPILFPIALLSYFIFWATERYQIAYFYGIPPAMDDRMIKNAMRLLSYTPIFFLFNSYWMLSNRQMFEGVINSKDLSDEEMSSSHDLNTIWYFNHATPLIYMAITLFVLVLIRGWFP